MLIGPSIVLGRRRQYVTSWLCIRQESPLLLFLRTPPSPDIAMIPAFRHGSRRAFSVSAAARWPNGAPASDATPATPSPADAAARPALRVPPLRDPAEAAARDGDPTPPHLPPRHVRFDLVSSPDPVSNIRRIRVSRPADEHSDERDWRLRREAMVDWHHSFWADNNLDFFRARTAFERATMEKTGNPPTHTEMSEFYKSYLDGARERHMEYNRRWWKENFSLLAVSWRGELRRAIRAVKRTVKNGRDTTPLVLPTSPAAVAAKGPKKEQR